MLEIEHDDIARFLRVCQHARCKSVFRNRSYCELLNPLRDCLRSATLDRLEIKIVRAAIFGREVDAAVVRRPDQAGWRAVKTLCERAFVFAVNVHHVEFRDRVSVVCLIEARVSDQATIVRDSRISVRAVAVCKLSDAAIAYRKRVNVRTIAKVFSVRLAHAAEDNLLRIGSPFGRAVIVSRRL